jgi:hypothetical protein
VAQARHLRDLPVLRAPQGGRLAGQFAETTGEVCLICKTTFCRDSAQRLSGYHHQLLSTCDSHSPDVLARGAGETHSESTNELALAEMRHLGEISQIDFRVEVNGHVTLAACPPRFHENGNACRGRLR